MQKTILYICISIIIISIFFTLIPNKNMEASMKFILNIFLIGIILTPIITNISKIDFSKYKEIINRNENEIEDLKNSVEIENKRNLEKALQIVFSQNGYKDLDISININKEKKTTNILIKMPYDKKSEEEKIKQITKKQTGLIPKIEYY